MRNIEMSPTDVVRLARYLRLEEGEFRALEPTVWEVIGDDGLLCRYDLRFRQAITREQAMRIPEFTDGLVSLPPGFFDGDENSSTWPQG